MSSSKFKLGDGSEVRLTKGLHGFRVEDNSATITRDYNGPFGYMKDCYRKFLSELKKDEKLSIIHLGSGLGYDLLWINDLFKNNNRNIENIVGVDFTDYKDLRVSEDKFDYPIEFYNMDADEYLNITNFDKFSDTTVIVFVDLFLKGIKPIDLVYKNEFWKKIADNINPNYIVVNRCSGNDTHDIVKNSIPFQTYDKSSYSLEVYGLEKA